MDFEKMLNELAQGNRDAFQRFYDRYGLPVYRYILEKTGDPERTRALWKEVFRSLMHRLRNSEEHDLPLLLLTALADVQLASTPGSEHTAPEVQAQQLSSELLDELHEKTSDEGKPAPITEDDPVSEPHCAAPEAESTDMPECSCEPEALSEPEAAAFCVV